MNPFIARVNKLQAKLSVPLLVTNPVNVRYLTGLNSSNACVLVLPDEIYLATDDRYAASATKLNTGFRLLVTRNLVSELLAQTKQTQIAFEASHVSYSFHRTLCQDFPHIDWVIGTKSIEELRQTKDEFEIAALRSACEISTASLTWLLPTIQVGDSERDIAMRLERAMIDNGADERAFASIVAGGPNSAIPHHEPTNYQLVQGDFLKIDFGAKVSGYHADCTRTFIVGRPAEWQQELHQQAVKAAQVGRDALAVDATYQEIDQAVRSRLTEFGVLELFTHGLGHGVGLEIHEDPFFGPNNSGRILPNTTLTIEPGLYRTGLGGVRIEDSLVVTTAGIENLCDFSYELISL